MAAKLLKILRFPSRRRDRNAETDEQVVLGIQRGDQGAWGIFLDRYTSLIYVKAREYSRTEYIHRNPEDLEDEVTDLYVFMATHLRQSFRAFQRRCKPRTWVMSIINNRRRILKAYLLEKYPDRAEFRLPRVMQSRSEVDREIFKRMVWGQDTGHIALALDIPEARCRDIEALLSERSPRVWERILTNRISVAPKLSIDALIEADEGSPGPRIQVADPGPDPEEDLIRKWGRDLIRSAVDESLRALSEEERRVLILLYNEDMAPAEIVRSAGSDPNMGLSGVREQHQVYARKDSGLGKILDRILRKLEDEKEAPPLHAAPERDLLKMLEEFLRGYGFPVRERPPSPRENPKT